MPSASKRAGRARRSAGPAPAAARTSAFAPSDFRADTRRSSMRSRGMVGLVAFLLATIATFSIFLYVHGVKHKAETGGAQVTVIVSKKDIPAATNLDTLITAGTFTTETIPKASEVQGAVSSLEQLKGRRTSAP